MNICRDLTKIDLLQLGWFANPIFSHEGGYPAVMREQIDSSSVREGRKHSRLPTFSSYWIEHIRGSADFLGLNYYTSRYVELLKEPSGVNPSYDRDLMLNQTVKPEWKLANVFFLYSVPAGLGDLLRSGIQFKQTRKTFNSICTIHFRYIKKRYNNPRVFITENGWSDDGELNDQDRIEFFRGHLTEVLKVVNNDEYDLIGYTGGQPKSIEIRNHCLILIFFLFCQQLGHSLIRSNLMLDSCRFLRYLSKLTMELIE